MTDRRVEEPRKAGPDAALVVVAAIIVLAGVRWLERLGRPALALIAAAVVIVVFVVWVVRPRRQLPRHRVRVMRLRARLGLHPGPGHATAFELWLRWGRLAAARRARRSRPSLLRRERLLRPWQTSVLVARAHYGHALRVPVEEHVLYIAPPRAGKTGTLAEIIARHPGPAVVTSTRGDLYELTAAVRASSGPVYVFNPQRLAAASSSMRWDVLGGCADPATAIRRAQPLSAMATFKGEGEDFWAAATELWLQTLLHVAALRRASMGQHGHSALLGAIPVTGGIPARPARRGRGSRAVGHADPRPDDLDRDQDHRHHPVHGRGKPGVHARSAAA
jgi:hypothetical protein